jgi:hypothetical protein
MTGLPKSSRNLPVLRHAGGCVPNLSCVTYERRLYGGKVKRTILAQIALALMCFQIAAYSQAVPYPGDGPGVYVVRVISVDSAQRDAYVACLAQTDLPFWRGLKEKGLLAKVSVFETTSVTRSDPLVPAWNFVIASQLAEGAKADSFVQAVEKRKGCENAAGVEVRRTETLRTTPNCNDWRSTPADDLKARESKVEFTIEYIAVKDTPETLDRYRKFMSLYECLPAQSMIRDFNRGDGLWFGGVALETAKVNYSQPGMLNWNQIHFFGMVPPAARAGRRTAEAEHAAVDAAYNEMVPGGIAAFREGTGRHTKHQDPSQSGPRAPVV